MRGSERKTETRPQDALHSHIPTVTVGFLVFTVYIDLAHDTDIKLSNTLVKDGQPRQTLVQAKIPDSVCRVVAVL
jgi:hypothetical protein